jgi:ABC-type spermidine/putrescine transport system permease subunit I
MKSLLLPAIILALLCACFLAFWDWSGPQLPERVATHFNVHGESNGWMSRAADQEFMLVFGLTLPLFIVVLNYATRFLPPFLVNIPHRNYWLAPERRRETSDYLLRGSLWFACLAVLFVIGLHYATVQANKQNPPHLSMSLMWAVVAPFIAGTIIYLLALVLHFRRVG